MSDTAKEWFWRIVLILIFVFMIIDSKNGDKENKRWAYVAENADSVKWERVIAHIGSDTIDLGHNKSDTVYYVYAIELPDNGELCDAHSQAIYKLKTDKAYSLSVYDYPRGDDWNYIRLTDEKVK